MLKALNVGGKNVIPMKALAALFESCGARDVKTYVNSGNVVFDATAAVLKTLPRKVVSALQEKHDIESCVVLRTREALQAALAATPFATKDTKLLMYGFFEGAPDAKGVAALDPEWSLLGMTRPVGGSVPEAAEPPEETASPKPPPA
jgi:uncharacterized protein (DUF1697 family)